MQDVERKRALRREMDSYLTQRRKSSGWGMAQESPLHPTVQPYKEQQMHVEEAPEQVEEEHSEVQESSKGWFGRMVEKLFGDDEVDELMQEDAQAEAEYVPTHEETQEDLKTIATISLNVMKTMPGNHIKNFKDSGDYEVFKNLLKKHKLIK
jgi:hypothetical protein